MSTPLPRATAMPGAPSVPGVPTAGTGPVNQKKQFMLDRIAKLREQSDEAVRLKQEADEREKRVRQEQQELTNQVKALEVQLNAFKSQADGSARERDEVRGRVQSLQTLLASAQKDKETLEAEVGELRSALDDIHKALQ